MQPARAEVVQNLIFPSSTATTIDFFGARMSFPSCVALRPRVAEVVRVAVRPDDGEDERVGDAARSTEVDATQAGRQQRHENQKDSGASSGRR